MPNIKNNAALRAEVERKNDYLDADQKLLLQLRARVAELEADKERLDWLAANGYARWTREAGRHVAGVERTICAKSGVGELPKPLRAALDAARKKGAT